MGPPWPDFPQLTRRHLSGARLYAERNDLIRDLPLRKNGKVAEIGVWRARFSKFLVSELKPQKFFAFDVFTGHLVTDFDGMTGRELFDGLTHRQYYERKMARFQGVVTVIEGPSQATLPAYGDHSFDLVYVDADHAYEAVKVDAELATRMVADTGFLVFNDYTLLDPNHGVPLGVVPVVNDLVVNQGWEVVGYAINPLLFSDVALCRSSRIAEMNDRLRRTIKSNKVGNAFVQLLRRIRYPSARV